MSETYEPKRETRCINERRLSLTPLQWNKANRITFLNWHSAVILKTNLNKLR